MVEVLFWSISVQGCNIRHHPMMASPLAWGNRPVSPAMRPPVSRLPPLMRHDPRHYCKRVSMYAQSISLIQ
jgi:hypothetical protein